MGETYLFVLYVGGPHFLNSWERKPMHPRVILLVFPLDFYYLFSDCIVFIPTNSLFASCRVPDPPRLDEGVIESSLNVPSMWAEKNNLYAIPMAGRQVLPFGL